MGWKGAECPDGVFDFLVEVLLSLDCAEIPVHVEVRRRVGEACAFAREDLVAFAAADPSDEGDAPVVRCGQVPVVVVVVLFGEQLVAPHYDFLEEAVHLLVRVVDLTPVFREPGPRRGDPFRPKIQRQ